MRTRKSFHHYTRKKKYRGGFLSYLRRLIASICKAINSFFSTNVSTEAVSKSLNGDDDQIELQLRKSGVSNYGIAQAVALTHAVGKELGPTEVSKALNGADEQLGNELREGGVPEDDIAQAVAFVNAASEELGPTGAIADASSLQNIENKVSMLGNIKHHASPASKKLRSYSSADSRLTRKVKMQYSKKLYSDGLLEARKKEDQTQEQIRQRQQNIRLREMQKMKKIQHVRKVEKERKLNEQRLQEERLEKERLEERKRLEAEGKAFEEQQRHKIRAAQSRFQKIQNRNKYWSQNRKKVK